MQGGNEVDYPGAISTSCQRSRCAVLGRPAGRRGENQGRHLFGDNAIKSACYMEHNFTISYHPQKSTADLTPCYDPMLPCSHPAPHAVVDTNKHMLYHLYIKYKKGDSV